MQIINGQTHTYGIIGDPVTHSLSPLFQNYFLEQAHHNAVYIPFHIAPNHLTQALQGLHAAHVQGLNITIPHKENIIAAVHADADAQTIGAVNTLKRVKDGWDATNTDWQGFASVIQGLEVDTQSAPVLLFGAGGTARAILHALNHQNTTNVFLCNRNQERANTLALTLKETYPNMTITTITWTNDAVASIIQKCGLLINSTSIGLNSDDTFPFTLNGGGVAIDAVYKPDGETIFCTAADSYQTCDGLPMLIAQGIASFAFWHHQNIQTKRINLPNKLISLQWVEKQLGRQAINLSGWRI